MSAANVPWKNPRGQRRAGDDFVTIFATGPEWKKCYSGAYFQPRRRDAPKGRTLRLLIRKQRHARCNPDQAEHFIE
jgi:hypothetical protein